MNQEENCVALQNKLELLISKLSDIKEKQNYIQVLTYEEENDVLSRLCEKEYDEFNDEFRGLKNISNNQASSSLRKRETLNASINVEKFLNCGKLLNF